MIVLEAHYFPCIQYFAALCGQEKILLEAKEHYIKQSYRNRCYIRAANKVDRLSVPVLKAPLGALTQDIRIDYSQRWQSIHARAMRSAYSKAPFFDIFIDDFEQIIFKKQNFLLDLNVEILTLCLKYLRVDASIDITAVYKTNYEVENLDFRNTFVADNQLIKAEIPTYQQIFGNSFVSNLSIIDLLFCVGNQAGSYLKNVNFLVFNKNPYI
ncbi:MAG: hypothetical protein EAZ08_04230 [Cytophagales bacterium]|nr:MAG: hypothetical protein EAZ08_04230 [Cytophagales bacterium]